MSRFKAVLFDWRGTLFRAALDALAVAATEALMVGDRASRDGGAIDAGIATLLLPPVANGAPPGLELVPHLVSP